MTASTLQTTLESYEKWKPYYAKQPELVPMPDPAPTTQPQAPEKPETKPSSPSTPKPEPPSSKPRAVVVVGLTVAALSLLGWWLKRRP